jgi:hypothetical protein
MVSDYPLFDDPPFQAHSGTSRAAAEGIRAAMPALRRRVLDALGDSGERGLTDEEGIDGTGLSPSTYRPRRVELCERGLAKDSGRTRRVRSGKAAVVWVAASPPEQA